MLTIVKSEPGRTNPAHWKKGQSGNPSGHSKERRYGEVDIAALARSYGRDAIHTLVLCLRDPRYKLQAAIALLDRGYGKPQVSVRTESEGTMLHLVAAQMVGDAIVEAIQQDRPVIDADVDTAKETAALDEQPPLE